LIFEENNNKLIITNSYKKEKNKAVVELSNTRIYNKTHLSKSLHKSILKRKKLNKINILKFIKLDNFQDHNLYRYNEIYKIFNEQIFKYILQSKVIRSLFEDLYPNKGFIFEKNEVIKDNKLKNFLNFIGIDLNYLKDLNKSNIYGFKFKKNGDLIINMKN